MNVESRRVSEELEERMLTRFPALVALARSLGERLAALQANHDALDRQFRALLTEREATMRVDDDRAAIMRASATGISRSAAMDLLADRADLLRELAAALRERDHYRGASLRLESVRRAMGVELREDLGTAHSFDIINRAATALYGPAEPEGEAVNHE